MTFHYITLQSTYHTVECALFSDTELLKNITINKHEASRFLMSRLHELLEEHSLTWKNITFLGVNQGPAPFTTLRALITTVNGISFSRHIPLVGVDGLRSFLYEQHKNGITIVLQNAFAQDVYFAEQEKELVKTGWANGTEYLEELAKNYPTETIKFVGNGVPLLQKEITELFSNRAEIAEHCPEVVQLTTVAELAKQLWLNEKKGAPHLTPLYLKTQEYKTSS